MNSINETFNKPTMSGDSYMGTLLEKWRKLKPETKQEIIRKSCYVGMSEYDYEHVNEDAIADFAFDTRETDLFKFSPVQLVQILISWRVNDK